MAEFKSELYIKCISDKVWMLTEPLIFESDILGTITVPAGFYTDFASVPRVPIFYLLYGDMAHRESVLHDYGYRKDSSPCGTFMQWNRVFLEAMYDRGKPFYVRYVMYLGVVLGGLVFWHKRNVYDKL